MWILSRVLETLDSVDFASLEDAYGPAVDVPERLRLLAAGTREEARAALSDLEAGIFHQGSYYSAAAPSVPFLVEIAGAPTPLRADVLIFLADMSGAPADMDEPFDPFVFRSSPGAPTYPEATDTIAAIVRGEPVYVAALDAADARVRSAAAFLLSRIARVPDALAAALTRETDPFAEAALCIAIARAGARPEAPKSELARAVVAAGSESEDALAFLLREPLRTHHEMPFYGGDLSALALEGLRALEGRGPEAAERAWTLVHEALEDRFARGERFVAPPTPAASRVRDEPSSTPTWEGYGRDRPLRGLLAALARIAFGDHGDGLVRREHLDARQREVLGFTVTYGVPVPVPSAPWITPEAMTRFLEGGGPLDREVELGGVRAPAFVHLQPPLDAHDHQGFARAIEELAAALGPDELFDVVVDLLSGAYDLAPGGHLVDDAPLREHVLPRVSGLRARFVAAAHDLAEREASGQLARFVMTPQITACEAPPPELDRLAGAALGSLRAEGMPWLRTFPEPRRSRIVARFGNAYLLDLFGGVCTELSSALLEAFVAPECAWWVHDAEGALGRISTEALRDALPGLEGRRASIVRRVLRAKTGEGSFTLTMRIVEGGIDVTLVDWLDVTRLEARWSAHPQLNELSAVPRALAPTEDPFVQLEGDVDAGTEYRVMRLLSDAGFRGTVRAMNRTTSMNVRG